MNDLVAFVGGEQNVMLLILGLLVLVYIINMVYRCCKLFAKEKMPSQSMEEGVSVILTVNNNAYILREHLELYLQQDYPVFEVIVVDDGSEDDTKEILEEMQKKYSQLHATHISSDTSFRSTKKLAINIGIAAAKYDILLFSEIIARPVSSQWIRTMAACFEPKTALVIGYANFELKGIHSAFHYMVRLMHYWRMLFLSRCGCYVTGDGFNMAYRKSLYKQKRIFSNNAHSYIGYDHEVFRQLSEMGNVVVTKQKDAHIEITEHTKDVWRMDYMNYAAYYYAKGNVGLKIRRFFGTPLRILIYCYGFYLLQFHHTRLLAFLTILLIFLTELITINFFLKHLAAKKIFVISFVINLIGCFYRAYLNWYSRMVRKRWM